jgi:hypothetical protein
MRVVSRARKRPGKSRTTGLPCLGNALLLRHRERLIGAFATLGSPVQVSYGSGDSGSLLLLLADNVLEGDGVHVVPDEDIGD